MTDQIPGEAVFVWKPMMPCIPKGSTKLETHFCVHLGHAYKIQILHAS
jgi:hypothetical protein